MAAPASARSSGSGFKSREEYLKFLEQQRPVRGEAWYNQKLKEANAREEMRGEKRKLSDRDWRLQIRNWGADASAIESVAEGLGMGDYEKPSRHHRRYKDVAGGALLLNMEDARFWFMDRGGIASLRNKSSGIGVLSLVTAVKELAGEAQPYSAAKRFLIAISGIQPKDFSMTPQEMEKIKASISQQAKAVAAPKLREEVDIDPEKIPVRITDPAEVLDIRRLVAAERGFPESYVQRLENEGTIFYGRPLRKRGDKTFYGKPVVASPVLGFETGKTVAISTRRIPKLDPHGKKGICEGQVSMGASVIGPWNEHTTRVFITEGVYDAAALRLMRERDGTASPTDCYMILSGARVPTELVRKCAARKIEMVAALDNDIAGRTMERNLREEAAKCGGTVSNLPIKRGEVDLAFRDSTVGRAVFEKTVLMARQQGIPLAFKQPKDDFLRMTMPTTDASCKLLEEIRRDFHREFRASLSKELRAELKEREEKGDELPANFDLSWHRKDWNELVKQPNYQRQVKTTAGLPVKDATLRDEALKRLTDGYSIDPAVAERMLEANVVYPVRGQNGPKLVWPLTDGSRIPVGAMAEPIEAGSPRRTIGQPGATISLAAKSPIASEYIVADTIERGVEAWIKSGYTAAVDVVPDCRLSPQIRAAIASNKMPVRLLAEDSKIGTQFRAEVQAEAEKLGLPVEAFLDRSPKATIALDARPDDKDPGKEKRAEAEAKRLHDLAIRNKQSIEVIRTKDGFIQIHAENHGEMVTELSGVDADASGSLDPDEVQRRAAAGNKARRVVIEYHGRGIDRSTAAQAFRGWDGIDGDDPKKALTPASPAAVIDTNHTPSKMTTAQIAQKKSAEQTRGMDIDDD